MEYKNFDIAYHQILKELIQKGELTRPRGIPCYEILNYNFTLEDPSDHKVNFANLPVRQEVYEKYLKEEHDWYMSGNLKASSAPSKFWLKLADDFGNITSNYGHMVFKDKKIPFKYKGDGGEFFITVSSYEYVVDLLKKDPDSRQAIIHYGYPDHFYEGNKDIPCTVFQQFFIREKKLHCMTVMRSQDVWKGIVYDIPWFCKVQMMLLESLRVYDESLTLGKYFHHVGSLHLYESNLDEARKEIL